MYTCRTLDTGWVKEAVAQWGGGGCEGREEAKETQIEEQAKQEIWKGIKSKGGERNCRIQLPVNTLWQVKPPVLRIEGMRGMSGSSWSSQQKVADEYIFWNKTCVWLNRLGKNLIPDQFSFQALAVKEGRRRKESQREELFSVISDTVQGSFGQRSSAGWLRTLLTTKVKY